MPIVGEETYWAFADSGGADQLFGPTFEINFVHPSNVFAKICLNHESYYPGPTPGSQSSSATILSIKRKDPMGKLKKSIRTKSEE